MSELKIYSIDASEPAELPYADDGVRAGVPSPAQDFMSEAIDLNRDLVTHPESTFYARVEGDSWSTSSSKRATATWRSAWSTASLP